MGDNKGKKLKVGDEESPQIDGDLVLSIEKLQEVQDELEKINEKASDEVLEVEKKYNEIRQPIYDKRNKIIEAIPHFWVTAFLSHPALSELVNDEDNQIFKHLTSIEVEDSKDVKSGYSISFNFSPNPYFENKRLTKMFTFLDEGATKVTATSIGWKEGMGIPNGVETVDNEKNSNKRVHAKESFFAWFTDIPQNEDEIHDEVAEIIKEDLWPNPLTYFNNDADEVDFEGDEDDDEEKDEGSDGEGDDEDGEDDK